MGLGGPSLSARAQQVLQGQVPGVCSTLQPIGTLPTADEMRLAIALPLRNRLALEDLLQQLYDPASSNYHQYLSREQFTDRFGPTEQDYQAVIAFAQTHNLSVTYAHSNRMVLDVAGKAADVESALHVKILVYQHPTEDRTFYAPDSEPSLDLTTPISRVAGLDNYSLPRPNCIATGMGDVQVAGPNGGSGSGPSGEFSGYDFRNAYLPGVQLTGSGQAVGLLEFDGYSAGDITYYEQHEFGTSTPNVPLVNVLIDGFDGNPSGENTEVTLDIDMAIAMAPGLSAVIVYEAPGNPQEWINVFCRMADDNMAKQLSVSWSTPNGDSYPDCDQILLEMAAQGQTMFVASGDGDAEAPVIWPGASPLITSVGGTELTMSGGKWAGEAVWNWYDNPVGCYPGGQQNYGSTGGYDGYYPIPSWQTPVTTAQNFQGSKLYRNAPDVALTADNVFVYQQVYTGAGGLPPYFCIAGTSCAAPLWAGLVALVNEQAALNGQPVVGFLNPALYAVGQTQNNYAHDFNDITSGNNWSASSPNLYSAVGGYDLCTGWGTPKATSLINDLLSPPLAPPCALFSATPMNNARNSHTATLLPNGLVLVAGGNNASGALSTAELYDGLLTAAQLYNWPPTSPPLFWQFTAYSLKTARAFHTATLLPSGLVLASGGVGQNGALASSELYSPSAGTWTLTTRSMATARYSHTATLLPTGLVLAAGGTSGSGPTNSAELYTPSGQTWNTTGTLNTARTTHTATLLSNGQVLVAGGTGQNGVLASSELYNPSAGTWTLTTGSLNTARSFHTATLLPNGLVLVAGGYGTNGVLASCELYNPATKTWTTNGSLITARYNHTATLLPTGLVLVTGGDSSSAPVTSAEIYNPNSGAWQSACSLNTACALQTATLLPTGLVLVAGGADQNNNPLPNAQIYDADLNSDYNGSFTSTGSLRMAHPMGTTTLLPNDTVLVAGGNGANGSAELYNPTAQTWGLTGYLNNGRYNHAATLLPNGLVLVQGGQASPGGGQPIGGSSPDENGGASPQFNSSVLASAELYSPSSGTWTTTGSLTTGRCNHTATLLPNALVLAAGGQNNSGTYLTSAELYQPNGTWTTTGPLNTARSSHTATLLPNGSVLVAGGNGQNGTPLPSAELYNPGTTAWTPTSHPMNTARVYHTATLLPNGLVLVAGGYSPSGPTTSVELYNPSSDTWTTTGPLNTPREYHTATLLPTGSVLVAGGSNGSGYLSSAELYDPNSNTYEGPNSGTWLQTGSLTTARGSQTATLLPNDLVLIAGGSSALTSCELYNP